MSFDSEQVSTRCVLIATGADYRKLDVPKREQFEGLGVYYAATATEMQLCRGAEVIVVGGGNSAGQAVMFLSEETRRVYLLLRGGGLRKGMSSYLADRIEGADNVEVLAEAEICRMMGDQWLEAVTSRTTALARREPSRPLRCLPLSAPFPAPIGCPTRSRPMTKVS